MLGVLLALDTDAGMRFPRGPVGLALRPPCPAFLTWWHVTHLNARQGEDKVMA